MTRLLAALGLTLLVGAANPAAMAQDDTMPAWNGVWTAEGTFFSIAVSIEDNVFRVTPVESMGFEWSAAEGFVSGSQATLQVFYGGASAIVNVQLLDSGTAVATADRCLPDYMVVCVLAKDQQARFVKLDIAD